MTQYGQPTLALPARFPDQPGDLQTLLGTLLVGFGEQTDLTPDDIAFFGGRIWQLLTSCQERRLAEYESVPWWTFIDADSRSAAYRKFLATGNTRSLVAAQATMASTRTVGAMFVQLAVSGFDPTAGDLDRVLDRPTSDVWIGPWRQQLAGLGVEVRTGAEALEFRCRSGRITGIVVSSAEGTETVVGDHYVCALPVERAAALMNSQITAADPALASLQQLAANVEWMNGVQYYLFRDLAGPVLAAGVGRAIPRDVEFNGIVSVDVSDWDAPGLHGRAAVDCTPEQVAAEVWEQLKRSVNTPGTAALLTDDNLAGWLLDPNIAADPARPGRLSNLEPLLVNYVDTWRLRPGAATCLPNLFLADDYVRTHTDLAMMEGANESARRAVNAILDACGSAAPRCGVWPLQEPVVLEPLRSYDAARFRIGLPWDSTLLDVAAAAAAPALAAAGPVLASVAEMISQVEPYADPAAQPRPHRLGVPAPTVGEPAGPDGLEERIEWYRHPHPAPVRPDPGVRRQTRQGSASRPVPGDLLCVRRMHGVRLAAGGGPGDAAQRVPGPRRHRGRRDVPARGPGMHRQIGVPLPVNAGDAMNALATRLFRRDLDRRPPCTAARTAAEVNRLVLETLEGQATELAWIRQNAFDLGTDDYLRLVLKKTAWYSFIHPMRLGALAAGGRAAEDLGRFDRCGFLLGAAFQIQDDVLNLIGTRARYGKEIGSDLREGKRTLILSHALTTAGPDDRAQLQRLLARPGRPWLEREQAAAYELLDRTGSIRWAPQAAELATAYAGAADGPDLDLVRSMVSYVVARDV